MSNSIRDNLDYEYDIAAVKLYLNAGKNNIVVIVEGNSDIRIFQPLFRSEVWVMQTSAGKIGVEKAANEDYADEKRVIGIRDKDYEERKTAKCFYPDYCCAEMMIISIDDCFSRFHCNIFPIGFESYQGLRKDCLEHLELLSKVRKLNEIKQWGIELSKLGLVNLYQEEIEEMNNGIISRINIKNNNALSSEKLQECKELKKCETIEDYLEITNGHDFIDVFIHFCKKHNIKYSKQQLSALLRSTFGESEFKVTNLYKNLKEYQEKNELELL